MTIVPNDAHDLSCDDGLADLHGHVRNVSISDH